MRHVLMRVLLPACVAQFLQKLNGMSFARGTWLEAVPARHPRTQSQQARRFKHVLDGGRAGGLITITLIALITLITLITLIGLSANCSRAGQGMPIVETFSMRVCLQIYTWTIESTGLSLIAQVSSQHVYDSMCDS